MERGKERVKAKGGIRRWMRRGEKFFFVCVRPISHKKNIDR